MLKPRATTLERVRRLCRLAELAGVDRTAVDAVMSCAERGGPPAVPFFKEGGGRIVTQPRVALAKRRVVARYGRHLRGGEAR